MLALEFSPLILCAPLACVTVTPATRFRKATSFTPGKRLVLQLAASVQAVVPAPPSQQTPVQTPPLSVRRKRLPTIAPLIPGGTDRVVKLPEAVPEAVITSKLCEAGTKPLISGAFRVPPSVTLPVTTIWSYWVPATVPPSSTSIVPVLFRLPMMASEPAAPLPPGFTVP